METQWFQDGIPVIKSDGCGRVKTGDQFLPPSRRLETQ